MVELLRDIPVRYRKYWKPIEHLPAVLAHFTSAQNANAILETGHILAHDPSPRDWHGLPAVYMVDPTHPAFSERYKKSLAYHFCSKGGPDIHVLQIQPEGQLYRCTIPKKASYCLSLSSIPADRIVWTGPIPLKDDFLWASNDNDREKRHGIIIGIPSIFFG
ncbi:MAG: hypothetical protein K9G62_02630 [Alphaproteobacteria bacterium]|nr:hypothetical protein [Alphaproteobacteria bacterium]